MTNFRLFSPFQLLRDGPRSANPCPNQSNLGHSQFPIEQANTTSWRRLKPGWGWWLLRRIASSCWGFHGYTVKLYRTEEFVQQCN